MIRAQNSTFAEIYNFYEISLSGILVIVAERKSYAGMNGSNIVQEYRLLKEYFSCLILLETTINDAVFRRQLINKKVNFVVPGHQLYFPELYIIATENKTTKQSTAKTLTISAQVLLLYHLQKKSLAGMSFKKIAKLIGYSAKTVTLIVEELCNFGIARVEKIGRYKTLHFYKRGEDLYLQVDKWMQSPVISYGYTDRDIEKSGVVQVGHGVLDRAYSDNSQYCTYGISSKKAKELRLKLYATYRTYSVEIWKYEPSLIGTDGYADILSVLLSRIETMDGYTFRHHYNQMKKDNLGKVKWADIEGN